MKEIEKRKENKQQSYQENTKDGEGVPFESAPCHDSGMAVMNHSTSVGDPA